MNKTGSKFITKIYNIMPDKLTDSDIIYQALMEEVGYDKYDVFMKVLHIYQTNCNKGYLCHVAICHDHLAVLDTNNRHEFPYDNENCIDDVVKFIQRAIKNNSLS